MSFVVCDGCSSPEVARTLPKLVEWIGSEVDEHTQILSPFIDEAAKIVGGQQDLPDEPVGVLPPEIETLLDVATSFDLSIVKLQELKAGAERVMEEGCQGRDGGRCPSADAIDAILRSMSETKVLPQGIER